MRLYVGNIPYSTTEQDLRDLFGPFGGVTDVKIMVDRETGRARGFAFVELADGGDDAIRDLDQTTWNGRNLVVNQAKDKKPAPRSDRRWRS